MSKQFLTRIVTASAAASLLAFSATLPAKADTSGTVTLDGDVPASCTFSANASPADSLVYNTSARVLDVQNTAKIQITTTGADLFNLSGSPGSFTRAGAAYTPTYNLTANIENNGGTQPSVSNGSFSSVVLGLLTNDDVQLGGTIGPASGATSLFEGVTNPTGDPINFNFVYTFTCAPNP